MRKNLIILILCLVFLFSVSGCFFNKTPSSVETTAAVSESDLTQKIELKGITYYIPADFQTMGKEDATILRHINTNDDNLLVGYLGDYDDSYMDTTEKHIELGSLAISSVKSSEGIDPDYDYTIISDLAVVKTTYTTKDTYNISYHFFANNGAYCMSYSSKEPISESNSKLLEKIVETVAPSEITTEAPTTEKATEKPTEKETEQPTTQVSDALHELYNDDRITLSFYQIHDYEYDPNESRIEFWAENKTDKNLTIQSDLVSVNGISYKGNMSGQVLPHTKGIIEMRFDQKIPVDMPSSIGMKISYFDGILGDTIDENEIVIPETKIQ